MLDSVVCILYERKLIFDLRKFIIKPNMSAHHYTALEVVEDGGFNGEHFS